MWGVVGEREEGGVARAARLHALAADPSGRSRPRRGASGGSPAAARRGHQRGGRGGCIPRASPPAAAPPVPARPTARAAACRARVPAVGAPRGPCRHHPPRGGGVSPLARRDRRGRVGPRRVAVRKDARTHLAHTVCSGARPNVSVEGRARSGILRTTTSDPLSVQMATGKSSQNISGRVHSEEDGVVLKVHVGNGSWAGPGPGCPGAESEGVDALP